MMSMRRLFLYAIILAAAGFFVHTSSAQVPTSVPTPINTQTPECNQVAWSCAKVQDLDEDLDRLPHRIQLTQSGLPGSDPSGLPTNFYVACGTETDQGFLLTTGNSSIDEKLCLGKNTYRSLQDRYGYALNLINTTNPFTAPNGNIDIIVKPQNDGDPRHHMFMIGWEIPVTTTGSGESDDADTNEATEKSYGLEYTSFTFAEGAAQCTTVYSDPFGRTYNKQLKPVPGAKVNLFDYDLKSMIKLPGVPNPVTTEETGIFNFNVPAGRYYLNSNLTNSVADIPPNYTLAYTAPYAYGELIDEKTGQVEQRDIPVNGGATPVLKLIGYSHVRAGDYIHIQGIASWPLTLIDLMQGNKSIAQQQSDKFGNFTFRLDPSSIDSAQQITLKLTEVDLTVNPKVPAAQAKTVSKAFDPIPSYLEGYAYDASGKLQPFATVRVRMQISDSIYFETKADKDAFFTVAPRNLPILPYYLEIIPANVLPGTGGAGTGGTGVTGAPAPTGTGTATGTTAAAKVSVIEFAQKNQEYRQTQVIDIMSGTKNGKKVDPTAVADSANAVFGKSGAQKAKEAVKKGFETRSEEASQARAQQSYVTLLILVALLIFLGSLVVVFLKKRAAKGAALPLEGSKDVYTREEPVSKPQG